MTTTRRVPHPAVQQRAVRRYLSEFTAWRLRWIHAWVPRPQVPAAEQSGISTGLRFSITVFIMSIIYEETNYSFTGMSRPERRERFFFKAIEKECFNGVLTESRTVRS